MLVRCRTLTFFDFIQYVDGLFLFEFAAGTFGEHGVILELSTDTDSEDASHFAPRYISATKISAHAHEQELLFAGKSVKFKISNIYEGAVQKRFGHRLEISVLNNLQEMLQNGSPQWNGEEIAIFEEYCLLNDDRFG